MGKASLTAHEDTVLKLLETRFTSENPYNPEEAKTYSELFQTLSTVAKNRLWESIIYADIVNAPPEVWRVSLQRKYLQDKLRSFDFHPENKTWFLKLTPVVQEQFLEVISTAEHDVCERFTKLLHKHDRDLLMRALEDVFNGSYNCSSSEVKNWITAILEITYRTKDTEFLKDCLTLIYRCTGVPLYFWRTWIRRMDVLPYDKTVELVKHNISLQQQQPVMGSVEKVVKAVRDYWVAPGTNESILHELTTSDPHELGNIVRSHIVYRVSSFSISKLPVWVKLNPHLLDIIPQLVAQKDYKALAVLENNFPVMVLKKMLDCGASGEAMRTVALSSRVDYRVETVPKDILLNLHVSIACSKLQNSVDFGNSALEVLADVKLTSTGVIQLFNFAENAGADVTLREVLELVKSTE